MTVPAMVLLETKKRRSTVSMRSKAKCQASCICWMACSESAFIATYASFSFFLIAVASSYDETARRGLSWREGGRQRLRSLDAMLHTSHMPPVPTARCPRTTHAKCPHTVRAPPARAMLMVSTQHPPAPPLCCLRTPRTPSTNHPHAVRAR